MHRANTQRNGGGTGPFVRLSRDWLGCRYICSFVNTPFILQLTTWDILSSKTFWGQAAVTGAFSTPHPLPRGSNLHTYCACTYGLAFQLLVDSHRTLEHVRVTRFPSLLSVLNAIPKPNELCYYDRVCSLIRNRPTMLSICRYSLVARETTGADRRKEIPQRNKCRMRLG